MAPGQRSVFVGNIPFNYTEEQIVNLLSQAGEVVKFRLMTNPDNGKSKGFGFADFRDADNAAAAVRNLNDYEVLGRKIRVDWPHNNEKDSVPTNYDQTAAGADDAANTALPPLPPGVDLPPNLRCAEAISQTLSKLEPMQLLDALTQMKAMAISDPVRAQQLLSSAPQLGYAIFQALILMNLVDTQVLTQVLQQSQLAPQQPQPAVHVPPPQPTPQQQFPGYPPPPIPGQIPPRPPQQYAPTPPVPQQPPPAAMNTQQDMINFVLAMDQAQIDAFPPTERAQIMALRAQHQYPRR